MERAYFDHNATTPLRPDVLVTFTATLGEVYGNASSIHHFGQRAKQQLETARGQVAWLLGCGPKEVVFTSGGTEANNLALFGALHAGRSRRQHVITSTIEHPAVLNPCSRLERDGVSVTYVPVDEQGLVDPDDIRRALRPETALVSIMHANNEIGTIQPVAEIAASTRERGVLLHVDGVQAAGKLNLDIPSLGADLYSVSAHKLNAPKGVGALYVRPGVRLEPLQYGGRHERERRAGTENVPGAVAFGAAAATFREGTTVEPLRDRLEQGICRKIPDVSLNAAEAPRLGNTSSIRFHGIEGEAMVIALDLRGFAVSSGAACSSGAIEPSHVLTAIGLSREQARSCVRVSLGWGNTAEQVDALVDAMADAAVHLRRLSTAYSTLR